MAATTAASTDSADGIAAGSTAVTGIVLAAGAGTRFGRPKALVLADDGEPWVARAARLLAQAGCDRVIVVLGAQAEGAASLVPPAIPVTGRPEPTPVQVVVAADWELGMSESLRAGLAEATGTAALVTLVDLPDLPLAVVDRVLADVTTDVLRQAMYDGRPGHPVLVGRAHWDAIVRDLSGDRGARAYLAAHGVDEAECSDLFDGRDVDRPIG